MLAFSPVPSTILGMKDSEVGEVAGLYAPALWRLSLVRARDILNPAMHAAGGDITVHGDRQLEFEPWDEPRDKPERDADIDIVRGSREATPECIQAIMALSVDRAALTPRQIRTVGYRTMMHAGTSLGMQGAGQEIVNRLGPGFAGPRRVLDAERVAFMELFGLSRGFARFTLKNSLWYQRT